MKRRERLAVGHCMLFVGSMSLIAGAFGVCVGNLRMVLVSACIAIPAYSLMAWLIRRIDDPPS